MNKKLLTSLVLAGLVTITAGCDDSSKKVDEGIDKAKETATQVTETAQDKANELTEQAKDKATDLKRMHQQKLMNYHNKLKSSKIRQNKKLQN
ncbi:hypothetical protein AB6H17_02645 [Proteus vulgaris]|uniref:hypothetical protein n=1 Tax=Proteus vulgaris TaxID=585 RepID=UPI0034DCD871